jgi:hypothetical protein
MGLVWFATYDKFLFEDDLRKVLSRPEFKGSDSSFPEVYYSASLFSIGNGIDQYQGF